MAVDPSAVDVASAALVTPTDTFVTGQLAAAIAARQLKTTTTEALAALTIGQDMLTFLGAASYSAARALLDGKSRKSNIIGSSTTLANTTHSGAVNRTTVPGIVLTIDASSDMDYWCETFFIAQDTGDIEFQVNGGVTLNGGTAAVALATDALGLLLRTGSTDYWLFQIGTAVGGGGGGVWGSITGTLASQSDLAAELAAIQAATRPLSLGFAGKKVLSQANQNSVSSGNLTASRIFLCPFWYPGLLVSDIAIYVATPQTQTARAGIYRADPTTGLAGLTLAVAGATEMDLSGSAGERVTVLTGNYQLPPEIVWVAVQSSSAVTPAQCYVGAASAAHQWMLPKTWAEHITATAGKGLHSNAITYGVMPATLDATGYTLTSGSTGVLMALTAV